MIVDLTPARELRFVIVVSERHFVSLFGRNGHGSGRGDIDSPHFDMTGHFGPLESPNPLKSGQNVGGSHDVAGAEGFGGNAGESGSEARGIIEGGGIQGAQ